MTHSHEYRLSLTIPLSGSDREQSAKKAQIHPLIDTLEEAIRALGLSVTIEDSTVKLGRGKKAAEVASPGAPNLRAAE